jgi:glycosyltransferase involved in cell wall biosynthesis
VTFFQGEDSFLDGLPEPFRTRCWTALGARLRDSDLVLSPSRFYADFMARRLGAIGTPVEIVPNGIHLEGYAPAAPTTPPAIGYLARMNREKGLEVLVDAFLALARDLGDRSTRLRIAGAATAGDQPLITSLQKKISAAGLGDRVEWSPNLTREQKVAFLRGLTVFSVPATYEEAFGLYVIEAMACALPVVQPASAAFPELLAAAGSGVTVPPRDPSALARAWRDLLADPARRQALGDSARAGVQRHFSAAAMAASFRRVVSDRVPRRPTTRPGSPDPAP